jgi:hypothetical protein
MHLGHSRDRTSAGSVNPAPIQAMSTTPLFDPNDPLVSSQDLIQSASEVLSELKNGLLSETQPEMNCPLEPRQST